MDEAERLCTRLAVIDHGRMIAMDTPRALIVLRDATKPEIKAAVELLFKVQVKSVQVANVKGKEKRFGRFIGRRRHWKNTVRRCRPERRRTAAQILPSGPTIT